ncbi:hypothetical protein LCGC14_1164980 [marine sediment metagenome]|uniref:Uncharacterized protein n=1 Tax=marine sediment metagenome TaxID=412755 RepID=A0A0F9LRK6_9ZZZZ
MPENKRGPIRKRSDPVAIATKGRQTTYEYMQLEPIQSVVTTLDYWQIKQEVAVFIRNSDIFTTTQRGVTTQADSDVFTDADTFTISRTNVKNIRSVVINGSTLTLADYSVDYGDGSENCVITFNNTQNGSYTIRYDYGTDKIFPDFPRPDLSISSFPRIAVDLINLPSDPGGFGNVNENTINFTVVVYDLKAENIANYLTAIRNAFISNFTGFVHLSGYVRPTNTGPLFKSPFEKGKDKILQQNIDFTSPFKFEIQ